MIKGTVGNENLMRVVDLRGVERPGEHPLARADMDVEAAAAAVSDVLEDVRLRGAGAVIEAGERFDGIRAPQLRVPKEVLTAALHSLDPDLHDALVTAIARVRLVHEAQMPDSSVVEVTEGGTVTQRWIPVDRVGLYVPGGRAVYPSSVIMNVVPAQIAGVESLAVASPPQADNGGWPHPVIMAACALLDVDEVYAAGGAQAVGMFAYGVELPGGQRCEPVAMVTGPGNIYVTAAKRLLRGLIGIDSEAGPTEIMVVADVSADPAFVAADLISQAEHDVVAASVLVTDAPELVESVQSEVVAQVAATKHSDRIREALSGPQSAIVLVDDIDAAMAVSDAYAAEHLEIHTSDARNRAMGVRNAGAVFVGHYTPVSLGDYAAGSNHVLPTGGCACHSSGLSVQTFLRGVQVVEYDQAALRAIADTVTTLATAEDLPAHGAAITARTSR